MATAKSDAALEIRKLRKKLRQIENLERKSRELTDEEILKITQKAVIRDKLLRLLAEYVEEDEDISVTASTRSESSFSQSVDELSASVNTDISNQDFNFDISKTEVTIVSREDEDGNEDIVDVEGVEDGKDKKEFCSFDILADMKGDNNVDIKSERNRVNKEIIQPVENKTSPVKNPKTEKAVPVKSEKNSTLQSVTQKWRSSHFEVVELEGHSDLITAVDSDDKILVSASRDTTVKVWDLETLTEVKNLGGHTSAVTSVVLLTKEESAIICNITECRDDDRIILSGSVDCSFKIWSFLSGQALKSVYTYSPVTKIVFHPVAQVIITGSDGGKLDVWELESGTNLQSLHSHDDGITGLQISDNLIYSSCADGIIKVYELRDKSLACIFVSENLQSEINGLITQRHIRGFMVNRTKIFYGDDGVNIKILNWKSGKVHKLTNHLEDFGITDCFCCHGNVLISSAYNLDAGLGYLNVRCLPEENYITSLNDEDTERIISITCSEISKGRVIIVTAGLQLKVWIMSPVDSIESSYDGELIKTRYISKLTKKAEDSDVESDMEFSDSEHQESDIDEGIKTKGGISSRSRSDGWLSWCSVL